MTGFIHPILYAFPEPRALKPHNGCGTDDIFLCSRTEDKSSKVALNQLLFFVPRAGTIMKGKDE